MINDKNQTAENISNATVNQIKRDQNISQTINVGISTSDAFEISRNVVKQELALYTNEALKIAQDRFTEIAEKAIDRISSESTNFFPKFKDPAIQLVLNETYKEYIKTGDEELGDNLISMLIDRLEVESKSTKQFIIDDAREILPKLSVPNLSFLALNVFSKLIIPFNGANGYTAIIKKLIKITNGISSLSELDIMYLKQSGCAMGVPMIHVNKKMEEALLDTYENYFSKGINKTQFNELLQKHNMTVGYAKDLFSQIDINSDNSIKLRFPSNKKIDDLFQQKNIPKVNSFLKEFISLQNKATSNDVINFHQAIDPNWKSVFSLWDKELVKTLSIMPVALYIGSIYLSRAIDLKIPREIFYK